MIVFTTPNRWPKGKCERCEKTVYQGILIKEEWGVFCSIRCSGDTWQEIIEAEEATA